MRDKLMILYHTPHVLVAQTLAGAFDKFGNDLYGEFNMGLHVGDNPLNVLTHRVQLFKMLEQFVQIESIYWLNQVHGSIVANIDQSLSMTAYTADALMTVRKGQALAIMTADCIPIAIFDDGDVDAPVACIHAGWQGLTNGIIANTVLKIRQLNPSATCCAIIGAHIGQSAYEINKELANKILDLVCANNLVIVNHDDLYQLIISDSQDNDKCLIDLDKLTRLQLDKLGVQVANESSICTYTDPRFYSYRAQTHAKKRATGRMATLIVKL